MVDPVFILPQQHLGADWLIVGVVMEPAQIHVLNTLIIPRKQLVEGARIYASAPKQRQINSNRLTYKIG